LYYLSISKLIATACVMVAAHEKSKEKINWAINKRWQIVYVVWARNFYHLPTSLITQKCYFNIFALWF